MNAPAFTKRGRVWTREENDRIVQLYQDGVKPTEIAAIFGVSRLSIESKLHYWGIRKPKPVWTRREIDRAVTLRNAGATYVEIGRALNRPPESVREVIGKDRSLGRRWA